MAATQQTILTTTVVALAALTQQRFVGADNAPCQAGAIALGVAEVDGAAGDEVPVNVLGIIAVEAGAVVGRGKTVQSDSDGRAIEQVAATETEPAGISNGFALDEATAEGDIIRILRGV
ncbi:MULTISPECIES: DUF2190 family protein [unclassified Brenneria]|uniref:DUF2190 family protein n=1 Tax=unclassified Brenneria TaxID=2634434 RepID=UPI0029C47E32|nr:MULTISPECIES: DUF2190 family protein [unclassified Brenneria]MDX5630342.1 DUF2190 family protein [Brenneria sp. L3-3Z]MDX5697487.1 DUF2190 family protein [Brenneria sp. L4-2C]